MRSRSFVKRRVDEGGGAWAAHRRLAEVRDVENANPIADGGVLGQDATAGVLERHRPTAEFAELGAEGDMALVQGRAQQRCALTSAPSAAGLGARDVTHVRTLSRALPAGVRGRPGNVRRPI